MNHSQNFQSVQDQTQLGQLELSVHLFHEQQTFQLNSPINLVFEIRNHSPYAVKVLKWGTPLEGKFSREYFKISSDGNDIDYTGLVKKRVNPQPSDFIVIPAGGEVHQALDLQQAYAIEQPGIYQIKLKLPLLNIEYGNRKELVPFKGIHQLEIIIH